MCRVLARGATPRANGASEWHAVRKIAQIHAMARRDTIAHQSPPHGLKVPASWRAVGEAERGSAIEAAVSGLGGCSTQACLRAHANAYHDNDFS